MCMAVKSREGLWMSDALHPIAWTEIICLTLNLKLAVYQVGWLVSKFQPSPCLCPFQHWDIGIQGFTKL